MVPRARPVVAAITSTIVVVVLFGAAAASACTIGVASGEATPDGRPLLWKVRDNGAVPNNEVYYNDSLSLPFVAVCTADAEPGSPAWMGTNVHGFALINANANNLVEEELRANGEFMRAALGSCRSVDEFVALLAATDGLRDTHANFGVIDSTGAAMIIEASREAFWTYDTRDTERGFIIRTNFACADTAGTGIDGLPGVERFVRSTDLISSLVDAGELTVASLAGRHARDFSNWASQPVEVPCYACGEPDSLPGYFDTYFSISATGSVSAAVIQGVAPPPANEAAWLTTMWVQLGQPACTLPSPYWPVGPAPAAANGPGSAPLCDLARMIRAEIVFDVPANRQLVDTFALLDGEGGGLWSILQPAENAAIAATEARLAAWRSETPAFATVLAFADSLANAALELLQLDVVTSAPPPTVQWLAAYPNPFNPTVTLSFDLPYAQSVRLDVHDLAGRRVARLVDAPAAAGIHTITWQPERLPSGVYLARLERADGVARVRMTLAR